MFEILIQIRETRLSPRRAPRQSLLPLSPKRTQVRLKSLLYLVWLAPDSIRTHGRPSVQECRLRLKRPPSSSRTLARHLPFKSSTAARSCSYGLFPWAALLRFAFGQKNMAHHIFQSETELQNIPEAAPKASRSFSVSEKLARYGSSALSGVEHLRLLVGKDSHADALLRHFASLQALSRASLKELRQFLPKNKTARDGFLRPRLCRESAQPLPRRV